MTYRSICVVSAQRTGSNHLMSRFCEQEYENLGEAFRRPGRVDPATVVDNSGRGRSSPLAGLPEEIGSLRFTAPGEFLDRAVVGRGEYEKHTLWKVQYQNVFSEDGASWRTLLIDYLRRRQEICVVLLTRDNLVERFVSQQVARETGHWAVLPDEAAGPGDPIRIRPRHLLANIERIESQADQARRLFERDRMVEVSYEEFVAKPEQVRADLERGLDMPIRFQESRFAKQGRPLRETVQNYDEIRSALLGTPWERFVPA